MKKIFSIITVLVLVLILLASCENPGLSLSTKTAPPQEILRKTINDGIFFEMPDPGTRINSDFIENIRITLFNNWQLIESGSSIFISSSRDPASEQHSYPTTHGAAWTQAGLYSIDRLWENPPVRSFYQVWVCMYPGCNEGELEFLCDLPL